jgi:hypothetical protein
MNLAVWLPAFVRGTVSLGLCGAFVEGCNRI